MSRSFYFNCILEHFSAMGVLVRATGYIAISADLGKSHGRANLKSTAGVL